MPQLAAVLSLVGQMERTTAALSALRCEEPSQTAEAADGNVGLLLAHRPA